MKCVPKVNCDFEGVMTEEVLELGPELEMLRVPLIVSSAVNRAAKFLQSPTRYKDPTRTKIISKGWAG